jgi:ATP-dependent RNA helicase DDX19/DBP5
MLDQDGLGDQTLRVKKCAPLPFLPLLVSNLCSMIPRTVIMQIILFSATFPDHVRRFASKFAPDANKIELRKNELSVSNIRQFYMDCRDEDHKYDILVSLYSLLTIGQSIIFCKVSFPCLRKNTVTDSGVSTDTRRIGYLKK